MHVCFYGVLAHLQEFTDSSSVRSPVNLLSWIDRVHSILQLHTFSFQSQQHGTYRVQRPAVSTLHHLVQRPPCWQQKFQWRRVAAEDWTSKTVGTLVRSAHKQTHKHHTSCYLVWESRCTACAYILWLITLLHVLTLMLDCKIFDGKAVVGFELSQRRNSEWTSFAWRLKGTNNQYYHPYSSKDRQYIIATISGHSTTHKDQTVYTTHTDSTTYLLKTASSSGIQEEDKWQFCRNTHFPLCAAAMVSSLALSPWPWPRDTLSSKTGVGSTCFANCSRDAIGSVPTGRCIPSWPLMPLHKYKLMYHTMNEVY